MLLLGSTSLLLPADELEQSQALFADSLGKLTKAEDQSVSELKTHYLGALERLRESMVKQGDLEQILQISEEKKWVTDGAEPPELPADASQGLVELRAAFGKAHLRMQMDHQDKKVRLADAYLTHLEGLQRKRVQQNDIEGAVKCREEIERIQELKLAWTPEKPPVAVPLPEPELPPAGDGQVVTLRWHPREEVLNGTLSSGGDAKKVKLESGGRHQASLKGLDTREGGITRLPGAGEALAEACKVSNAVTIVVGFETDDLKQSGPARIIGISDGPVLRNFTIGQERERLVLRFRTTETGFNGTSPQIALGNLVKGRHTQVAITYSEARGLTCFRDGREIKTQRIGGTLENWEPMSLQLGDESTQDRKWIGEIKLFEIRSEAVTDADAKRLSRER